jgi:hypothetical protein
VFMQLFAGLDRVQSLRHQRIPASRQAPTSITGGSPART